MPGLPAAEALYTPRTTLVRCARSHSGTVIASRWMLVCWLPGCGIEYMVAGEPATQRNGHSIFRSSSRVEAHRLNPTNRHAVADRFVDVNKAYPDMEFTPAPGTPAFEANRQHWELVIGRCCTVCEQPIGPNAWMLTWEPHRRAHLSCWEDRTEADAKVADDPWMSEASATRLKLTIGGFRELPMYQRAQENTISTLTGGKT